MNLWIPFCAFLYFLIPFWSAWNHMIFHKGPIKPKMAKGHWHIGNWAAKSLLFFGVKVFWESSSISYCSNSYQPYCPSTETAVSKNLQVTFRILHSSSQHLMFFLGGTCHILSALHGPRAAPSEALDSRRKKCLCSVQSLPSCRPGP